MKRIIYISLFLISFQLISSKELNKLTLHPEIDNSNVVCINVDNDFVDIYTLNSGFRFDGNLNFIKKFYEVENVTKEENRIHAVDYIKDKIYISTYTQGLVILNKDLEIIENYTKDNSNMPISSVCATLYDSLNGNIFSRICKSGIFVIDKMNNHSYMDSISTFLWHMAVSEMSIINNVYYMSVWGYEHETFEWREELIITDSKFRILDTIKFDEKYNITTNVFHKITSLNNFIVFYTGYGRIVIIEDKSTKETVHLELESIEAKGVTLIKPFGENMALCTNNGIFEYDLKNNTTEKIRINNDLNKKADSLFRDLDKYWGDSYLAASGNGVYILDNETSVSTENKQDNSKYFKIENNILTSTASQLSVEILNIRGQRIFSLENFKNINLENVTTERGVYILLFSINNSVVASSKYIR